jgi:hypothetical protein
MAVDTSILPARRVPRVDVADLGLSAFAIVLLAVAVVFVAHRVSVPSDGTDVRAPGNPFAADGVTVTAANGYPGAVPIRAGDNGRHCHPEGRQPESRPGHPDGRRDERRRVGAPAWARAPAVGVHALEARGLERGKGYAVAGSGSGPGRAWWPGGG